MSIWRAAASKEKGGFSLLVTLTVGSIARCGQGLCPDMKSKTHLCIQQVLVLYSLIGGWCGWCTSGSTADWVFKSTNLSSNYEGDFVLLWLHWVHPPGMSDRSAGMNVEHFFSLQLSWCHPIDHSVLWITEWTWWGCYTCCQKLQSKVFHVIIAPVIMPTHKALSLLEVLACLLKMELAKSSQACGPTCVCAEAKVWTAEYMF
jgi:hypothetical protein